MTFESRSERSEQENRAEGKEMQIADEVSSTENTAVSLSFAQEPYQVFSYILI